MSPAHWIVDRTAGALDRAISVLEQPRVLLAIGCVIAVARDPGGVARRVAVVLRRRSV